MKGLAITALLSVVFSVLGQDVKSDAEKAGRDLAQQMVTKLEGISFTGWSDIVENEYGKHHYPNDSRKYEYACAFMTSYEQAYTELGSKVAGPRPEQTASGENQDVNNAIQKQLRLTPEDSYVFKYAFKFNLATEKGKPVWKCPFYQFNVKGYGNVGIVVFDQGKITYSTQFFGGVR